MHHRFKTTGLTLASAVLLLCSPAQALDYGPFSITGFVKAEASSAGNQCQDCQRFPNEDRQRLWADDLVPGKTYGTATSTVTLFQPWLAYNQDVGKGFKLHGLVSQRWRDGKVDIKGSWYEKNAALSHEDAGRLSFGAMTSRAWSVADYPYGSDIGVADAWASSGAGYGLLTKALRFTYRPMDVLGGDLVFEATHDWGNTDFKKNKPSLLELWGQYRKKDLALDMVIQSSRNGRPSAWGHGPFTSLTPNPADDALLSESKQSIAMVMARYDWNSQWQFSAGVRHNRWSGANAVITLWQPTGSLWNNMFNVDWNGSRNGVNNPGYPASSTDFSIGARHRQGDWSYAAGWVHLGKAKTDNPSERGQSNTMDLVAFGVGKNLGRGWQVHGGTGMVFYKDKGLAPLSMPGHASFSGVDSRVSRYGGWVNVGTTYTFN
jgi:hypothetical protein